jgi:hypothetical protein
MVDRQALKNSFRTAAAQSAVDPFALAKLIRSLPDVANKKKKEPKQLSKDESLQLEGLDWSGVLSGFMNAWEAAEAV